MNRFTCDGSYEAHLKDFTQRVLERYGASSPTAEREIMCMADAGNTAAGKLYADLVFYRKILRRHPYRESFSLYLRSAGISVKGDVWECSGLSDPLSFWMAGYFLVNYRRNSLLKKCEPIAEIDALSITERLILALELGAACIREVNSAGAVNLIGRILQEASEDKELFEAMKGVIKEEIVDTDFSKLKIEIDSCENTEECALAAREFFNRAAGEGYVYACNNLAAAEAENILRLKDSGDEALIKESVERYIGYLKLSADKYEPYAANRLGLFYMTGEILSGDKTVSLREYEDHAKAKEYFTKATVYPDVNSAWAFFNLLKYFQKDFSKNIELTNEYMDYIKELNPKVYDIAMDL